jgi:hypothetical protein
MVLYYSNRPDPIQSILQQFENEGDKKERDANIYLVRRLIPCTYASKSFSYPRMLMLNARLLVLIIEPGSTEIKKMEASEVER